MVRYLKKAKRQSPKGTAAAGAAAGAPGTAVDSRALSDRKIKPEKTIKAKAKHGKLAAAAAAAAAAATAAAEAAAAVAVAAAAAAAAAEAELNIVEDGECSLMSTISTR